MKLVLALLPVPLAVPVLLLLAVALGPVILAVLCAALFGLLVFAVWSLAVAVALLGRKAGMRYARHAHGPRA